MSRQRESTQEREWGVYHDRFKQDRHRQIRTGNGKKETGTCSGIGWKTEE